MNMSIYSYSLEPWAARVMMATESAKRRARRTAEPRKNELRLPPKNCEMCGNKMSGSDKHRACVRCLGPSHAIRGLRERGAFCLLCGETKTRYLRRRLSCVAKDQKSWPPVEPIPQLAQSTVWASTSAAAVGDEREEWTTAWTENHRATPVPTIAASVTTISSLINKKLEGTTDPVIGLDYVQEYHSPTGSVPPHYQCTLCGVRLVSRLEGHDEMLAHIKSWKHAFRYIKRVHPVKFPCEEKDAERNSKIKKSIRETAAKIEQAEGRGQLEVILKEPCDVPAFKGMQSAIPKMMPPMGKGLGANGLRPGDRFPGEFPPEAGPVPNLKMGGFVATPDSTELDMGHHNGGDGCGHNGSGWLADGPGRCLPEEFRGNQTGRSLLDEPTDQPGLKRSRPDQDSNSIQSTMLSLLDSLQIENEREAQIVCKLTQKLTDLLIEYRLRSVPMVPNMNSSLNISSL